MRRHLPATTALLFASFFAIACTCGGCPEERYDVRIVGPSGEVLAEGEGRSPESARTNVCTRVCTQNGEDPPCVERCLAGERGTFEVEQDYLEGTVDWVVNQMIRNLIEELLS